MRALKRGFRNFRRHPVRNLVVILLLFVCLTFSLSMLAVKLASDSEIQQVKESVGNYGEIKISSDYQMQVFEAERSQSESQRTAQARTMTTEQELAQRAQFLVSESTTDSFSQQPEVMTYDKVLEARISVDDLTNTEVQSLLSMQQRGGGTGPEALSSNSFQFEGNTNGASVSDFMVGSKQLVEGSFYTYQDYVKANPVVLIEKNQAETNDLSVGDSITALISGKSGRDAEVELKIIGIYETVQAEQSQQGQGETFNPAGNRLYAPLSVVQQLNATPGYVQLGSYYFDSEDSVASMQQVFDNELADGDKLQFATDSSSFETISDPLTKVGKTSMIGLAGALGACALIILLAMAIIIGGRTRELGVLKAIGATNRQVMAQYAVEVICICLVAIILAMGVSALISQKMGNWLMSGNTATASQSTTVSGTQQGQMPQMGPGATNSQLYKEGSGFSSSSQAALKLNVVYKGKLFLYGILILLFIGLLGMAVPVIWITRLKPARVLSIE